jgi:hypothetical protein
MHPHDDDDHHVDLDNGVIVSSCGTAASDERGTISAPLVLRRLHPE